VTAPTWRIELPASPAAAQAILTGKRKDVARAQRDLASASQELARFDPTEEAVSYSVSDPLFSYKGDLMTAINEIQAAEQLSYGLPRLPIKIGDQDLYDQWNAFVEQIRQLVSHYARVETALAGQEIGLTTVGWTGDFETTWETHVTASGMRTHLQAVHVALDSRAAMIRLASVVATGAVGLAAKTAVSGGVLLLPAVWKFVRDVLKELRRSWPKIQR
jgi:hypothetical protein